MPKAFASRIFPRSLTFFWYFEPNDIFGRSVNERKPLWVVFCVSLGKRMKSDNTYEVCSPVVCAYCISYNIVLLKAT